MEAELREFLLGSTGVLPFSFDHVGNDRPCSSPADFAISSSVFWRFDETGVGPDATRLCHADRFVETKDCQRIGPATMKKSASPRYRRRPGFCQCILAPITLCRYGRTSATAGLRESSQRRRRRSVRVPCG